jgi:hypothetical protein
MNKETATDYYGTFGSEKTFRKVVPGILTDNQNVGYLAKKDPLQ